LVLIFSAVQKLAYNIQRKKTVVGTYRTLEISNTQTVSILCNRRKYTEQYYLAVYKAS